MSRLTANEDVEIAFITEIDEVTGGTSSTLCTRKESIISRPDFSIDGSLHSKSPSIHDDMLERHLQRRASSVEEIRRYSLLSNASFHYKKPSSRPSQFETQNSVKRIRSNSRQSSVKSNRSIRSNRSRRSSRYSYLSENERQRSVNLRANRRRSNTNHNEVPFAIKIIDESKEAKHRKIVYIVGGTFIFILICCVLAVVITLTHQSEYLTENRTYSYYTFAPDAKIMIGTEQLNIINTGNLINKKINLTYV